MTAPMAVTNPVGATMIWPCGGRCAAGAAQMADRVTPAAELVPDGWPSGSHQLAPSATEQVTPAWVTVSPVAMITLADGVKNTLTNPNAGADRLVTVKMTPGLKVSVNCWPPGRRRR